MGLTGDLRPNLVVCGGGSLRQPFTGEALELSGAAKPNVLFVPTAQHPRKEYDLYVARATQRFGDQGAFTDVLHAYDQPPSPEELEDKVGKADIIWSLGGYTELMMRFWRQHGFIEQFVQAAQEGKVMGGGSAGMLGWFAVGHSDSRTYTTPHGEPWEYIFVEGTGLVQATGCPHHDGQPDNGPDRETDFDRQFIANPDLPEPGICVSNDAALMIHDGEYRVLVTDTTKIGYVQIVRRTNDGLVKYDLPISNQLRKISPEIA